MLRGRCRWRPAARPLAGTRVRRRPAHGACAAAQAPERSRGTVRFVPAAHHLVRAVARAVDPARGQRGVLRRGVAEEVRPPRGRCCGRETLVELPCRRRGLGTTPQDARPRRPQGLQAGVGAGSAGVETSSGEHREEPDRCAALCRASDIYRLYCDLPLCIHKREHPGTHSARKRAGAGT